jgi:hypothetical protein
VRETEEPQRKQATVFFPEIGRTVFENGSNPMGKDILDSVFQKALLGRLFRKQTLDVGEFSDSALSIGGGGTKRMAKQSISVWSEAVFGVSPPDIESTFLNNARSRASTARSALRTAPFPEGEGMHEEVSRTME